MGWGWMRGWVRVVTDAVWVVGVVGVGAAARHLHGQQQQRAGL